MTEQDHIRSLGIGSGTLREKTRTHCDPMEPPQPVITDAPAFPLDQAMIDLQNILNGGATILGMPAEWESAYNDAYGVAQEKAQCGLYFDAYRQKMLAVSIAPVIHKEAKKIKNQWTWGEWNWDLNDVTFEGDIPRIKNFRTIEISFKGIDASTPCKEGHIAPELLNKRLRDW